MTCHFLEAAISGRSGRNAQRAKPLDSLPLLIMKRSANVPAGHASTALLQYKEQLTGVLTYHVVAGKHFAADLAKQETLLTVQGGMLEVHEHHCCGTGSR